MNKQAKIFIPVLAAVLVYAVVFLTAYQSFDCKLTGFMCFGDKLDLHQSVEPDKIFLFRNSMGYDGQINYVVASDPLMKKGLYRNTDSAGYRYQRILYPVLSNILALGRASNIPFAMVFINLLLIFLSTWLLAVLLAASGANPAYSLYYALSPCVLITLSRSLDHILGAFLLILCLYLYREKRIALCALSFSLLLLVRESYLFIIAIPIAFSLYEHRRRDALVLAAAFIPFLAWQGFLYLKFGSVFFPLSCGYLTYPFSGPVRKILETTRELGNLWFLFQFSFVTWILYSFALSLLKLREKFNPLNLIFAITCILMVSVNWRIYIDPYSYARHTDIILIVSLFGLMAAPDKKMKLLMNWGFVNAFLFFVYFFTVGVRWYVH